MYLKGDPPQKSTLSEIKHIQKNYLHGVIVYQVGLIFLKIFFHCGPKLALEGQKSADVSTFFHWKFLGNRASDLSEILNRASPH